MINLIIVIKNGNDGAPSVRFLRVFPVGILDCFLPENSEWYRLRVYDLLKIIG